MHLALTKSCTDGASSDEEASLIPAIFRCIGGRLSPGRPGLRNGLVGTTWEKGRIRDLGDLLRF